ncbi:MAG: hypothetical protein IJ809_06845 [Clostridia bacterium]|nr:hypothetical protein [Clostridia bacterium]
MKKIIVVIVIALACWYGFEVYKRNNPEPVKEELLFDENYIFSFSFSDNVVSQMIYKTYYFYSNEKAICESVYIDRSTGETLKTDYENIVINDEDFSIDKILELLELPNDNSLSTLYSHKIYVKNTNKSYMIARNSDIFRILSKIINIK